MAGSLPTAPLFLLISSCCACAGQLLKALPLRCATITTWRPLLKRGVVQRPPSGQMAPLDIKTLSNNELWSNVESLVVAQVGVRVRVPPLLKLLNLTGQAVASRLAPYLLSLVPLYPPLCTPLCREESTQGPDCSLSKESLVNLNSRANLQLPVHLWHYTMNCRRQSADPKLENTVTCQLTFKTHAFPADGYIGLFICTSGLVFACRQNKHTARLPQPFGPQMHPAPERVCHCFTGNRGHARQ